MLEVSGLSCGYGDIIAVRDLSVSVEAGRILALLGANGAGKTSTLMCLVGIVTRRDLLQVFLRPDKEIREEVIEEVLVGTLWLAPRGIDVSVVEGVVTLTGHMERKSETEIALSMTRRIDGVVGVVGVVDKLTYRLDDARLPTPEHALHGVADDWLRRL